jgi:predicted lipoprotein with Yx(FWY)xxD motif
MMRTVAPGLLCAGVLVLAGCGSDRSSGSNHNAGTGKPSGPNHVGGRPKRVSKPVVRAAAKPTGTLIRLKGSQFGKVLFDGRGQAIYLFTKDARSRTRCFGECARAWPPVYTRGTPRAGAGVNARLLGTIGRGTRRQVTYRGRPLYFYAHEGRNVVTCQNVDEFGGTWLVVRGSGAAVR